MIPVSLYIWAATTPIVILIILAVRQKGNKPLTDLKLENFVSLALAVYATISSCQLIYKAFTIPALQELLGADNIPALVLGGFAVIWVSLQEVQKLL